MTRRILIVDDDPKVRTLLRRCLEGDAYAVREASDTATTLKALRSGIIDLITLDLQLGSDDGIDLARQIRAVSNVPIIMVTGRDDVIDRVVGLEVGADDYITKPFHVREVVARVKSVLRRVELATNKASKVGDCPISTSNNADQGSDVVIVDGLKIAPDRFELVGRNEEPVELTSGDFRLLRVFLSHPKQILSRERLMDLIGGGMWTPLDRTIDNQVSRLRRKIERDPSRPRLITTVRGVGYTFTGEIASSPDHSLPSMA